METKIKDHWQIRVIAMSSPKLNKLLEEGWEPFSGSSVTMTLGLLGTQKHFIYLRKNLNAV